MRVSETKVHTVGKTAKEQRERSHESQSVFSYPPNENGKMKASGSCSSAQYSLLRQGDWKYQQCTELQHQLFNSQCTTWCCNVEYWSTDVKNHQTMAPVKSWMQWPRSMWVQSVAFIFLTLYDLNIMHWWNSVGAKVGVVAVGDISCHMQMKFLRKTCFLTSSVSWRRQKT